MAPGLHETGWWDASLSSSALVGIFISVLVPTAIAVVVHQRQKRPLKAEANEKPKLAADSKRKAEAPRSLAEEPWCPKLEVKDWQEASQLPGCPWSFDGCDSTADVIHRIWRAPVAKELHPALETLLQRVKDVKIARVALKWLDEVHFAAIYQLNTGAEVFGGAPLELAVGVEMMEVPSAPSEEGLRRRRAERSSRESPEQAAPAPLLPCLSAFLRIHDGFGVLQTWKHLPLLMGSPGDSANGSAFYVYPSREMVPLDLLPRLVKFARVDSKCLACAVRSEKLPRVVYVELPALTTTVEDEDSAMSFVADTVCNISGHRVVPPSYMQPAPAA